ncbi:hypothetical protein CYMTET_13100 [Cymbomonas tetramitiformis]|uniref:Uncharacterized protein n=1 Tax=Cymbomonas tetramitiformis TaxID=36881 RepID=A0AAE0GIT7_9CHLO|nr:hypothetical protein CYMTET_13100 [Cymbomonas tetramitiformis]
MPSGACLAVDLSDQRLFWKDAFVSVSYNIGLGLSSNAIKLSRGASNPEALGRYICRASKDLRHNHLVQAGTLEVARNVTYTGVLRLTRAYIPLALAMGVAGAAASRVAAPKRKLQTCLRSKRLMAQCAISSSVICAHGAGEWELYSRGKEYLQKQRQVHSFLPQSETANMMSCFFAGGLSHILMAFLFRPLTGCRLMSQLGVRSVRHDVARLGTRYTETATGYVAFEITFEVFYTKPKAHMHTTGNSCSTAGDPIGFTRKVGAMMFGGEKQSLGYGNRYAVAPPVPLSLAVTPTSSDHMLVNLRSSKKKSLVLSSPRPSATIDGPPSPLTSFKGSPSSKRMSRSASTGSLQSLLA